MAKGKKTLCEDAFQNEQTHDKLEIVSQEWLLNRAEHLEANGKLREEIFQIKDDFFQMHDKWCNEMIQTKPIIYEIKSNVKAKFEAYDTPLQMVKDNEFKLSSNDDVVKI